MVTGNLFLHRAVAGNRRRSFLNVFVQCSAVDLFCSSLYTWAWAGTSCFSFDLFVHGTSFSIQMVHVVHGGMARRGILCWYSLPSW